MKKTHLVLFHNPLNKQAKSVDLLTEEKEFCQKNCKTDLSHTLLTDTFVLWTYLADMIKFDFAWK